MKYIKNFEFLFENYKESKPKIGDYVYLNKDPKKWNYKPETFDFIKQNIGKIDHIEQEKKLLYHIIFSKKPKNKNNYDFDFRYDNGKLEGYTLYATYEDILDFSNNMEDLQHYVDSNKYNL
jgi:hypothetical protein